MKSCLLAVVGLMSMIPGSVTAEMAAVDVPVFLGLGTRDIAGDPHRDPRVLLGCADVTLFVVPDRPQSQRGADKREMLWDRFATWVRQF